MAQCAAQWWEQPAGFTASCVRPYLRISLSQHLKHMMGKEHLKTHLLRTKKWEGMTAVNWLFPPLSLTPDFGRTLSNLNCAIIGRVALLVSFYNRIWSHYFCPWLNSQQLSLLAITLSGVWTKRSSAESDCCSLFYDIQREKKQRLRRREISHI